YPARVTYSFVPDGTSVGGVSSNLFATLNSVQSTAAWQSAIEKAAAVWESETAINLALVSDNGAPEGTSGNQQDDSRFGDIRISMIPQGGGVLAFASLPPPINGGTSAGDITFNSNVNWSPNSGYDLETVALHEFGHSLGLDHSSVMTAVLYAYYHGTTQNPTSDDVSGIQSVYGPIPSPYGSNKTIGTAWNLSPNIGSNAQIAIANQAIENAQDALFWYVTVPSNTNGTMSVSMQTNNLSSLSPSVVIFNAAQVPIAGASAAKVYGATAAVTISGVFPGQGFYIRNMAASGATGTGAFGLLVNFGSSYQAPIPPPNTVVASQPSLGGGTSNFLRGVSTDLTGGLDSLVNTLPSDLSGLRPYQLGDLLTYGEAMTVGELKGAPPARHQTPPKATSPGGSDVTTQPQAVHTTTVVHLAGSTPKAPGGHVKPPGPARAFPHAKTPFTTRHRFRPAR
ncbi:MAG: matrixin family metalloprotease, partial [Planctomycetia bacterium]|nr:matrixin family metalloprotease [Planctomycetia bacterium]